MLHESGIMNDTNMNSGTAMVSEARAQAPQALFLETKGAHGDVTRVGDDPAVVAIVHSLDRLEAIIDVEIDALEHQKPLDLPEINRLKSQVLLQLTRISRALSGEGFDAALTARFALLRAKLERGQELLQIHLAAAQEVASILAHALREAESDGTYSASVITADRER
jgi:hypothetical protein